MKFVGTFAIYAALYVSLVGTALAFVAGRTGSRRFMHAARFAVFTAYGAIALAGSVLLHALLTHDFSIQYVQSFSDETMPLFYLIGAFWGGQAGSLLFWVSVVGAFTSLCMWVYRDTYREFMPWVAMVSLSVMSGLLIILAFASNPFEAYQLIDDPAVGEGLNPLLQTPKMVLHPPSLLAGMASMTVPFAFAIAALITGSTSTAWVEAARKWILVPWLFLTIGNILGGMWAYEELGWGGYWAWDPVENAAFMPWLMATALIHSLMIQERRGMLKRWNVGLMIATFLLTIFGTYITRSGLIESVHTFAQSSIGDYFLGLLVTVTVASLGLFIWRWPKLKAEKRLQSVVSREAAFMLNNWLFLAMTMVVFFGTLWPRLKEGVTGQEVTIGPPWFDRWMVPLGVLMLFMMGVGMLIAWRRASIKNFKRDFVVPLVATLVLTPTLIAAYWLLRGQYLGVVPTGLTLGYTLATVTGCVFVTVGITQEFWRGISARRKAHGESAAAALVKLFDKQRRRYGGYVVHLGVVCAFLAFAGNALKIEQDVVVERGQTVEIGDYAVTYERLDMDSDREKRLYYATLSTSRGGEYLYDIHPGKAVFHASPNMPTSEIDIHSSPLEDFYAALVGFEPDGSKVVLKVFVGPFTWWFWFAGAIMMLGTFICLWPSREAMAALGRNPMAMGRRVVAVSIASLSFAPLALWQIESHTEWGSALRLKRMFEQPAVEAPAEPAGDRPEAATKAEEAG